MNIVKISDRHEKFIDGVLKGQQLHVAGKAAGFVHPESDAYPILTLPVVQKRFRKIVQGKAATQGLVVCLNYLMEVVQDAKRPDRMRLDAAKFVYSHHMPSVKSEEALDTSTKAVNEMTNAELHAFITSAEEKLVSRLAPAQTIDTLI